VEVDDHAGVVFTRGWSPTSSDQTCQRKAPGFSPRGSAFDERTGRCRASAGLVLRRFGDHHLGGEQQAGDRGRFLQRKARDLRRVEDHGGVLTGVLHDLAQRLLDRAGEDADALVVNELVELDSGSRFPASGLAG